MDEVLKRLDKIGDSIQKLINGIEVLVESDRKLSDVIQRNVDAEQILLNVKKRSERDRDKVRMDYLTHKSHNEKLSQSERDEITFLKWFFTEFPENR